MNTPLWRRMYRILGTCRRGPKRPKSNWSVAIGKRFDDAVASAATKIFDTNCDERPLAADRTMNRTVKLADVFRRSASKFDGQLFQTHHDPAPAPPLTLFFPPNICCS